MKPAPPGLHRFELVVFAGFEPTYSRVQPLAARMMDQLPS